jgi:hypothetical protein
MTPISTLIAAIVARVLDRRRCDDTVRRYESDYPTSHAPVPEDPRDEQSRRAWAEPEVGE